MPNKIKETCSNIDHLVNRSWDLSETDLYYNNGKVSIGTTSPQELLHIHSSIDAYAQVTAVTTGAVFDKGFLIGAQSTGNGFVWQFEDLDLNFGTNNVNRMVIVSNGNIDTGTFSASPQGKLDINGSIFQRGIQFHADYVS